MGLPWNRIFHELNLTPLINKMNELAQTVEDLASQIITVNNPRITIKQGGETKGSFTLNQANAQTINLDTGGGGGSTYTAGDGITITDSVISVTNPITKTDLSFDDAVIPCLYINSTATDPNALLLEDGTVATLADCLDLGESDLDIGSQFFRHWEDVSYSGNAKVYDYSTSAQTETAYSSSVADGTYNVTTLNTYSLFDECVQIVQGAVEVSGQYLTTQILLGKANGHLYAFLINQLYQSAETSNYLSSCTLSADMSFIKF